MTISGITIDNHKLNGFFDKFVQNPRFCGQKYFYSGRNTGFSLEWISRIVRGVIVKISNMRTIACCFFFIFNRGEGIRNKL